MRGQVILINIETLEQIEFRSMHKVAEHFKVDKFTIKQYGCLGKIFRDKFLIKLLFSEDFFKSNLKDSNCKRCSKSFKTIRGDAAVYCSHNCYTQDYTKEKEIRCCRHCSKKYTSYIGAARNMVFCSKDCDIAHKATLHKGLSLVKDNKILCTKCLQYKDKDAFTNSSRASDKKRHAKNSHCKECVRDHSINQKVDLFSFFKKKIAQMKIGKFGKGCDVTVEDLLELYTKQSGKCALTGFQMSLPKGSRHLYTISVDRINSNVSYYKDNIQLTCWGANRIKSNLTQSDLLFWCENIVNNLK